MKPYRQQALEQIPKGHYPLKAGEKLIASDFVWSFTSKEFLRADSPLWLFPPLKFNEEIIFAARKAVLTEFELSIPNKRQFTLWQK